MFVVVVMLVLVFFLFREVCSNKIGQHLILINSKVCFVPILSILGFIRNAIKPIVSLSTLYCYNFPLETHSPYPKQALKLVKTCFVCCLSYQQKRFITNKIFLLWKMILIKISVEKTLVAEIQLLIAF